MMERTLALRDGFCEEASEADVQRAIGAKNRTLRDFAALLSVRAGEHLEQIAQAAAREKVAHFGSNIAVFTPIYISNYCDNLCVYCGFNCKNKIARARLDEAQLKAEFEAIAASGLEEILILTGESEKNSPVRYIGRACELARQYFKVIGVEIYPLNSADYAYLHACGVDFVTVFQETYDPARYAQLHLAGNKRVFAYRFAAQERAIRGGMRGVGFAALLGLGDFRRDAFATGVHAWLLQRKYPRAEIAFSVPRLRPIINNDKINPKDVGERELLQVMCAYRLLLPSAQITISTRERAGFRDNAIRIAASKISAGVSVGIGGHSEQRGDEQFEISDARSVSEVCEAIRAGGLQPLMSEYIYV
ncbi:2-iminoacetate synthase ThiH [uncultured Campylobacter sp.]|uniref:2-iminoacetate synthase ThiH n=1 Tax=uncultured Campylobacter sp. TaxID=218934 RepID=UPI00262FE554|nr:2-iminoacetate synthase ThiH [uncultured Campylobacter sp.]